MQAADRLVRHTRDETRDGEGEIGSLRQRSNQVECITADSAGDRRNNLVEDNSYAVHRSTSIRYDYPVDIKPLSIAGAWSVTPKVHGDVRGSFAEWFRVDQLEDIAGFRFSPVQGNISRSAKGVVRGIHYADVPPGQAKYVMPVSGSIIDFVVDIRVGSPTFGQWDSVTLHSERREAILHEPGLGHAFVALDDETTVTYLVTDVFRPEREHGINPLDPEIGLVFPAGLELLLSDKDTAAPSLAEALAASALPIWQTP